MDNGTADSAAARNSVRRVGPAGAGDALAILREAAVWAAERSIDVWSPLELCEETFEAAARAAELVIGYAGELPAATMLLQTDDRTYWPEELPGSALYLHKVAVRRAFAGHGWLTRLVDFAAADAAARGIGLLRLDTILRPKLQAIYEGHGFQRLIEPPLVHGGRQIIRMQREL